MEHLKKIDPSISNLIQQELEREEKELNLIASENYTPKAVLEAVGSILTNKYAEGYPGKRYYGGCEVIDQVEQFAIDRCKELFGAEHVNVQPHAGSQANMAAYAALLQPGDTIMGMSLSAGGHLTHGHNVNFSGTIYKTIQYGVNRETEELDFDEINRLAHEHRPKLIVAGASAYSRILNFKKFKEIANSVNAYFMADIAHIAGLVAAQVHPSPIAIADCVTSTTHKTLRGPRSGFIMCEAKYKENIDRAIMPGLQGGPLMHVIAGKAVAFKLAQQLDFIEYQKQVIKNAQKLVSCFKEYGYRIVAGGTDNHLFIIDLRNKKINGRTAEVALSKAGITISRSTIPFDTEKPWITSGIRIGSPAVTTRKMTEADMEIIVSFCHDALLNYENDSKLRDLRSQVMAFCKRFPIYA